MILNGERDRLGSGKFRREERLGSRSGLLSRDVVNVTTRFEQDYVLSTNEFSIVREFVELAFGLRGFEIKWKGSGLNEIGYDDKTGKELIFVSEKYFRPSEVDELLGDSSKAQKDLGWKPQTSFLELVKEMVDNDCI